MFRRGSTLFQRPPTQNTSPPPKPANPYSVVRCFCVLCPFCQLSVHAFNLLQNFGRSVFLFFCLFRFVIFLFMIPKKSWNFFVVSVLFMTQSFQSFFPGYCFCCCQLSDIFSRCVSVFLDFFIFVVSFLFMIPIFSVVLGFGLLDLFCFLLLAFCS